MPQRQLLAYGRLFLGKLDGGMGGKYHPGFFPSMCSGLYYHRHICVVVFCFLFLHFCLLQKKAFQHPRYGVDKWLVLIHLRPCPRKHVSVTGVNRGRPEGGALIRQIRINPKEPATREEELQDEWLG